MQRRSDSGVPIKFWLDARWECTARILPGDWRQTHISGETYIEHLNDWIAAAFAAFVRHPSQWHERRVCEAIRAARRYCSREPIIPSTSRASRTLARLARQWTQPHRDIRYHLTLAERAESDWLKKRSGHVLGC